MAEFDQAEAIVETVAAALPDNEKPAQPAEIEALLRPFAPVTDALRRHVRTLIQDRCGMHRAYDVDHWMEANVAVGEGEGVEQTIAFLMIDTCTCVLDHLPAAIAHAKGPVDPRVLGLIDNQD